MLDLRDLHPLLPPREPPPENQWSRDLVITAVAFAFCFTTSLGQGPGALLAGLIAVPLVFRRRLPMLMLYGCTAAALPQLSLPGIQFAVVVVPYVIYSVARWVEPSNAARLAVLFGVVGSVLGPLVWTGGAFGVSPYGVDVAVYSFTCLAVVLVAYVLGRRRFEAVRSDRDREVAAETTLRMRLAASEQRARAAEVNERNRIARELHDIVAHSLSVIVVQAEGGRALAAKRPELAADVLDTIAQTSRESLQEMRRIVGVLRSGPGQAPADFRPTPGLGDIADLVARTPDRARLEVRGRLPVVSQALGLTLYRVAQEALTNSLKHAGPDARTRLLLDCTDPAEIRLDVVDDGRGGASRPDGRGNGLRGMHERMQLVGGRLLARPATDGGFEVRARVPLPPGPPTGAVAPPLPPRPARDPARTHAAQQPRTPQQPRAAQEARTPQQPRATQEARTPEPHDQEQHPPEPHRLARVLPRDHLPRPQSGSR